MARLGQRKSGVRERAGSVHHASGTALVEGSVLVLLLLRRPSSLLHPLVQKLFGTLQHPQPALRQILPCAVHVERQHPHARRRPLRRYLLRSKAPRNRLCIFLEQPFLRIGRLCIHAGRPLPLAMRAPVSSTARRLRAPLFGGPVFGCPGASLCRISLRCRSLRSRPLGLASPRRRLCRHHLPPLHSDANAPERCTSEADVAQQIGVQFTRVHATLPVISLSRAICATGNVRQYATVLVGIARSRCGGRHPRATLRGHKLKRTIRPEVEIPYEAHI